MSKEPTNEQKQSDWDDINRLVTEGALPSPDDDRPVFVAPGKPRPWPRATQEELEAFAREQWALYRSG
ncbi:MAG TPA: hypothetical protein VFW71_06395 [Actinomycetota bacterium]|nr:hypothetical protein [Actinomycetota bacterium]